MKALSPHVRDDIPSTIEVVGTTCFQPDHLIYDVQVMISLEGLEQDDIPLADLQDQYFRRITSLGIDKKEFKEDKLAYLALSYKKKGTLFLFDTTSRETFEQVLSVRTAASRLVLVSISAILSPEASEELTTAAIENAREKAKGVAEEHNRSIGKILKIKDNQPGIVYKLNFDLGVNLTTFDLDENYAYPFPVKVTFELL
ncbi:MAG: SIMPL domain-containing protein [Cytophagales bacterium]|nr:SIMPL domain-containing protein [Cytophagales bacterium]